MISFFSYPRFKTARSALPVALIAVAFYGLLHSRSEAVEMGAQWYVDPSGTAAGDGSLARPWDLETALNATNVVKPGDTVWLRGGTYTGNFSSTLNGAPGRLITVRQYPAERAVLTDVNFRKPKKDTLTVRGTYTAFWGFEITTTGKDSAPGVCWDQNRTGDAYADCIESSVQITGAHNKFINLTVHDTNIAFGGSKTAGDIEYYGNIIYNAGRNRHEHGIYPQNDDPLQPKNIVDNVFFNIAGDAIHLYGVAGPLNGFRIEGNTFFSSGAPMRNDNQQDAFIRVGGSLPASAISITNNAFYSSPDLTSSVGVELGYPGPVNKDVVFKDNYIASGLPVFVRTLWESTTLTGNTIYAYKASNVAFGLHTDQIQGILSRWDYNRYVYSPAQKFQFTSTSSTADGGRMHFADWVARSGQDAHSSSLPADALAAGPPAIFVRPNKYEAGRGFITVYNWRKAPALSVDISSLGLQPGQRFQVRDVQNLFGAPLYSGAYDNRPVTLDMMSTAVSPPAAQPPGAAPVAHTSPEFGVFLVEPTSGASRDPGPSTNTGSGGTNTGAPARPLILRLD